MIPFGGISKNILQKGEESNFIGTLNYHLQKAEKTSIFKNETFEGKHLKHSDSDASWFQTIEALKLTFTLHRQLLVITKK